MTRTRRASCKHRPLKRADGLPPPSTLRELSTAGHNILNHGDESIYNHPQRPHRARLILVLATEFCHEKTKIHKKQHLVRGVCSRSPGGSSQTLQRISSKRVRTCHGGNGIADRAVRRVKEATATAMVQSGLPDKWWDCAME